MQEILMILLTRFLGSDAIVYKIGQYFVILFLSRVEPQNEKINI